MSAKMHIAPVNARADIRAKGLLKLVHAVDESCKISVAIRVGSCDVTRISRKLRARVDEHGVPLWRRFPFQHLVMQNSAACVEGNNGVVRQLLFAHSAAAQKRQFDLEFAGASVESAGRGGVTQCAETVRLTQALELVRGFHG